MQTPYIPLKNHSYFSFNESIPSPEALVERACQFHLTALGLTDHRVMTGTLPFYQACLKQQIKPILGLEIDLVHANQTGKLTLLAKNRQGWANCCHLSSLLGDSHHEQGIQFDELIGHTNGLVCLTGGFASILANLFANTNQAMAAAFISQLMVCFDQSLFIEVQRYRSAPLPTEYASVTLARSLKLPLVATQDVFHLDPADAGFHKTITAIRLNCQVNQLPASAFTPDFANFGDPADVAYRYADLPEALANTQNIAEMCCLTLPLGEHFFPQVDLATGESAEGILQKKAQAGARRLYHHITNDIKSRLDAELATINQMGYAPIFLVVEDILNHARALNIPISSRGSAASSLVAHCLNITSPDPLALDLYFERFLNPARSKPPDIDTDIDSNRRDEVIQYVFQRFGKDRVTMVGTINRYRPRSAFGDAAKAHGITPQTIRQWQKLLPHHYGMIFGLDDPENIFEKLNTMQHPALPAIITATKLLLDRPKFLSVHPGGIVIAPFPICSLLPTLYSKTLDINFAQFDLTGIDTLGLIKIDLLGIRGLSVISDVARAIQSWRIAEFKSPLDVLTAVPTQDDSTSTMLEKGKTIGCFQIESPGMRTSLREIHARTQQDIMVVLALYRPGPLKGGLRDAFIRRYRGTEAVEHIHPSMAEVLRETYGVIIYQEQVLKIAHKIAGMSLAEADLLRQAMSHHHMHSLMNSLKTTFIEGAKQNSQIPSEIAERIWEMMAAFAGYGFPKAHAASYAEIGWHAIWCKTHFPAEFMAAVLANGGGYYRQRVYLMEARRLGLTIHAPQVNHSRQNFCVCYPKGEPVLFMGLDQVRDLTQRTITNIIRCKPFHTLDDFILRVDPKPKEFENLVQSGCLASFGTIPQLLAYPAHKTRTPGQLDLFATELPKLQDWSDEKKAAAQQEILGISLDGHPLEKCLALINQLNAVSTLEAESMQGERVCVVGMRQMMRRYKTAQGRLMVFFSLEDLEGTLDVIIPPQVYQKHQTTLDTQAPLIFTGLIEVNEKTGSAVMKAENIARIN